MTETTMPAAEAEGAELDNEHNSYEFAFHVLPTVAEGEVSGVFDTLKALITKAGGELFDEEAPLRTDLAYEIVKQIEGKHRRFHSAYFGWARFKLEGEKLEALTEEIESNTDVLRYIIIKLTKTEEQNPFRYHEAKKEEKVVVVEEKEVLTEATKEKEEEPKEVSEEQLDESLEKLTGEEEGEEGEVKEEAKEETPAEEEKKEETK